MRVATLLAGALALGGCSMTVPVAGQSSDGAETFTGKATGYADGSGSLSIVSSKGLSCAGNFVYVTPRTGSGTFTCLNGQSGPFNFVSTGTHGSGSGTIGGRAFTFTFG